MDSSGMGSTGGADPSLAESAVLCLDESGGRDHSSVPASRLSLPPWDLRKDGDDTVNAPPREGKRS